MSYVAKCERKAPIKLLGEHGLLEVGAHEAAKGVRERGLLAGAVPFGRGEIGIGEERTRERARVEDRHRPGPWLKR